MAQNEPATFKITSPLMKSDAIRAWQVYLGERFDKWNIQYPVEVDGIYGAATRGATSSFMRAWGVADTGEALKGGLSPEWRTKLRHDDRTPEEEAAFDSAEIKDYRRRLRDRYASDDPVCYPVPNMSQDSWGWHPGQHDGIDLICPWKQPILAICDAKVVRVSPSGWWGLGAKPTSGHPVSDGDGVIIIESTVDAGPFKKGMHFAYGHSEGATVREGDTVRAGDVIGHAGWANWPHVHFMVNNIPRSNSTPHYTGRGDRDPKPFLDYAEAHS
jgi:murein DD-endopeptidase MepM/ murein hydrolase activator NlpD